MESIDFVDFDKVDIRVGTILKVNAFPKARKPAYQLEIDFGPVIGLCHSSAQITDLYAAQELIGKQILAIVNFPEKQIANFMSQCLILGGLSEEGVVLLKPEKKISVGSVVR